MSKEPFEVLAYEAVKMFPHELKGVLCFTMI